MLYGIFFLIESVAWYNNMYLCPVFIISSISGLSLETSTLT